ncbi:MAG: tRNA (adenosine(37)-N6)-dimethylallyltransferase MiaA [Acidimicrobiales bacterium]
MLALVGPTATGKSAIAMMVAQARGDVEIVVVDAMQVYRRMDIGTAKPTAAEQRLVRHHMIDIAEPSVDYSLSLYQRDALAAIADIEARGRVPLLVGGTGLYLRAVVDQLDIPPQYEAVREALDADTDTAGLHRQLCEVDPVAASRMEPSNRRRIVRALEVTLGSGRPFSSFGPGLAAYATTTTRLLAIGMDRPALDARIEARYARQMEAGLLDEVQSLLDEPAGLSRTAAQALGYKELIDHVRGEVPLATALATAIARTRRFARRQERWFRRDPRIRWLDGSNPVEARDAVLEECNSCD